MPNDDDDKLINEAVEACRHVMIDLTVEQKAEVVRELHMWLVAEEATYLPEAAPDRQH